MATSVKNRLFWALTPQLATVNLHAAGIDVGAEEHWAAVPAC